jgi:hypothetical protein
VCRQESSRHLLKHRPLKGLLEVVIAFDEYGISDGGQCNVALSMRGALRQDAATGDCRLDDPEQAGTVRLHVARGPM